MDFQSKPNAASLNEYQAGRLRVTGQYIDKLLGEVEEILNVAASKAAFPRYSGDVAPVQRRTIEDYISRIRAQLVRVLDGQGASREKPSIPASRAIRVALGAVDIAVEELKPQYMRGYSDVLKEWTRHVTNQLVRRFETYAEGYRAQAERSLDGKDLTSEKVHSLQKDIRLLEGRESSDVELNSQGHATSEGVFPLSGEAVRQAHGGESDQFI